MTSNIFPIEVPMYSVRQKFGWNERFGVGLNKRRIDKLAQDNRTAVVTVGDDIQEYTIKARKVQTFPVYTNERIFRRDGQEEIKKKVVNYIVRKSALNPRRKKTVDEVAKEEFLKYFL